jgi:hypothetical protein
MPKTLMPSVTHDGLHAYAAAYANDPSWRGMIYLSLIGYRASVRAIWAALLDGQYVQCGDDWLHRIADVPYRTTQVALPENGLTHFVMLATPATRFLERGQTFYVLREEHDDLERVSTRFIGLFDLAVGVPVLPQWAMLLWRAGLARNLIEPCEDTHAIKAYRVIAESDPWLALIQEGIQAGGLK